MKKSVEEIYDMIATNYSKDFTTPSKYIKSFVSKIRSGKRILDIGCGNGHNCNYCSTAGFDPIGIDFSYEMLKVAKKLYPDIRFEHQDIRKIDYNKNSFDGIIATVSLIYLTKEEVKKVLKKINYWLHDDGILYLSVQEGDSGEIYIPEPYKPQEKLFLNVYSTEEMIKTLDDSNFNIIEKNFDEINNQGALKFKKLHIITNKK